MFRAGRYKSVENNLSRIKDLHVGKGFDWFVRLERTIRKQREPEQGIRLARQSAVLSLEAAFEALEDRSYAPVCIGFRGASKLDCAGCFWMMMELEVRCAKVCHLEVDLVQWTNRFEGHSAWLSIWLNGLPILEVKSDSVAAMTMIASMHTRSPQFAVVARELA